METLCIDGNVPVSPNILPHKGLMRNVSSRYLIVVNYSEWLVITVNDKKGLLDISNLDLIS